jgi:hypothetical protein
MILEYFIVFILIYSILICSLYVIFRLLYVDRFKPETVLDGCVGDQCMSAKCVGFNCQCNSCVGTECQGGNCFGENCKAGDCIGTGCKAGDCYGYNCRPGVCFDPTCSYEICSQASKNCQDGKAYILKNSFMKYAPYFPQGTLLNPQLCDPEITLNDIMKGRTKKLKLDEMSFETESTAALNLKKISVSTDPKLFKNENCELCIKKNNKNYCDTHHPVINEKGKYEWI